MEGILLNGEQYQLGMSAITRGLSMSGKVTIEQVIIYESANGGLAGLTGGIRMKIYQEDLKDYFIDTPTNRAHLLNN